MPRKKLLLSALGGISAGTLAGLVAARAINHWRMSRTWRALEVAEDEGVFSESLVRDLPEPAQRYFCHAIRPGTPLHYLVNLDFRVGAASVAVR